MQTIEEICEDQSTWLTQLEQRLAEEKRERNVIISLFHGRLPMNLPLKFALKPCSDDEL